MCPKDFPWCFLESFRYSPIRRTWYAASTPSGAEFSSFVRISSNEKKAAFGNDAAILLPVMRRFFV